MNLFANKNNDQLATQTPPRRTIVPRYGVKEHADAFEVTAHLPGVAREDLETSVDGENLTVFARRSWTPPADWATISRESANADYRLVLELDHRVNRDAVKAELKQGVLTLTLPKAEAVKPRKIEIQG